MEQGQTLSHYTILRKLGAGGMEEVYLAHNTKLDWDAGYYQVRWDGRNHFGRPLASGIYLYRIQAGKFTAGPYIYEY